MFNVHNHLTFCLTVYCLKWGGQMITNLFLTPAGVWKMKLWVVLSCPYQAQSTLWYYSQNELFDMKKKKKKLGTFFCFTFEISCSVLKSWGLSSFGLMIIILLWLFFFFLPHFSPVANSFNLVFCNSLPIVGSVHITFKRCTSYNLMQWTYI